MHSPLRTLAELLHTDMFNKQIVRCQMLEQRKHIHLPGEGLCCCFCLDCYGFCVCEYRGERRREIWLGF